MSLGIDRNKTGDIYVYDDYADIVFHRDITDYIMYSLEKISQNRVDIERISINQINYKEQEHSIMNITCSSMRLDNIVKHITNKSRETASEIIKSGNVKVNWQVEEKVTFEVKEQDMISVSRYGRFKVSKLSGLTKSGKYKVEIKHYI
jgi:RNA-binding protein YlmH